MSLLFFIVVVPQEAFAIKKLSVLPFSFSQESKTNYPDWIKHMQERGYGNAIWQELEDILYDSKKFELLMEPPTTDAAFRNVLAAKSAKSSTPVINIEIPDNILTINVNFFVSATESMSGFKVKKNNSFHSTVHLRYYSIDGGVINKAIPATGDGINADLIEATRIAARNATIKLLKRLN